ncbi:programmed cell death protein 2 isoform X1 [Oryzias latipes]|uniref:programmed cell death protein 2 isoform X1 n=1 Tax=Oryzias latipes TaxID=8090 RepID=UPI0005CBCCEA|nr:programmed cell death protein 2 isoform X1 [Oryzias latipes]
MASAEVVLGFLEQVEPWRLRSSQFPSKVGGKPAWLSQKGLPSQSALECEICRVPMVFLLQVYAPISGQERSFHRILFVFCCKTPECYILNDNRCMKVFRSQLPRSNEFYPYEPPPEDEPPSDLEDQTMLPISGAKLCWVCGCPGNKACSRCHAVTYCVKHHQAIHWKQSHKRECGNPDISIVATSPLLFPEFELVTEPEENGEEEEEEEQGKDSEVQPGDEDSNQKSVASSSLADTLAETDLEEMAMHETEENKVFQRFKKKIASEPHQVQNPPNYTYTFLRPFTVIFLNQVIRYCRGGVPLWVSAQHVPSDQDIPQCTCGAKRTFEFQVMPQLLNDLSVDSTGASIDWGTLVVYTCSASCNHDNQYCQEFIWKQDFGPDQHKKTKDK